MLLAGVTIRENARWRRRGVRNEVGGAVDKKDGCGQEPNINKDYRTQARRPVDRITLRQRAVSAIARCFATSVLLFNGNGRLTGQTESQQVPKTKRSANFVPSCSEARSALRPRPVRPIVLRRPCSRTTLPTYRSRPSGSGRPASAGHGRTASGRCEARARRNRSSNRRATSRLQGMMELTERAAAWRADSSSAVTLARTIA